MEFGQYCSNLKNAEDARTPIISNYGTAENDGRENMELPTESKPSKPNVWKPAILLSVLFIMQQFSGGYIVTIYAIQIFQMAGSVNIDEWTCLVCLGALRLFMAIVSSFASKKLGRRTILAVSGIGMAVSMFIAFAWLTFGSPSLFPALCILSYTCFSAFGYLVIPWTLISELLPHEVRGTGSGVMISFAYLLMFLTVKPFFVVVNAISISYLFLTFSLFSIVAVAFVHVYLPETLGKTFEEIAKNF